MKSVLMLDYGTVQLYLTAARFAQLVKHQSFVQEVVV
jgi:hypothetical protein